MPSETLEDLSMALVTGLMDRVEVSETTSGRTIRLTKLL